MAFDCGQHSELLSMTCSHVKRPHLPTATSISRIPKLPHRRSLHSSLSVSFTHSFPMREAKSPLQITNKLQPTIRAHTYIPIVTSTLGSACCRWWWRCMNCEISAGSCLGLPQNLVKNAVHPFLWFLWDLRCAKYRLALVSHQPRL